MKGGLVAAVWAVRALRRAGVPLRGDVLLAGVQGEEDGGLGCFALLERGWRADACVVPEPTSLDVVPANAGALTFRLRVPGAATHASRRLDGVSAIDKLWPVWLALHALEQDRNVRRRPADAALGAALPPQPGHRARRRVGVVGARPRSRPRAASASRWTNRSTTPVPHSRPPSRTPARPTRGCATTPCRCEWWGGQFAPGRTDPDSPLVHGLRAARARTAGAGASVPDLWGAPYGSDLRLLAGCGHPDGAVRPR